MLPYVQHILHTPLRQKPINAALVFQDLVTTFHSHFISQHSSQREYFMERRKTYQRSFVIEGCHIRGMGHN